ncbi:MAG: ABC transporter substrate-binding protein [Candidatus Limnocylindria bacterium]
MKFRSQLAILTTLAIVLSSCAGAAGVAQGTRTSDQLQKMITAARSETQLKIEFGSGFLNSSEQVRRQTEGFNRLYGLSLLVASRPGPSMREVAARTLEEFQSGRTASTDVVLGTEADMYTLARAGALVQEPWSTWAPNIRNLKYVAAGGVAVQVQTRLPGITYNSVKLTGAAVPHSMADLLKPQYKGRIATTVDGAWLDRLGSPEVWGADGGFAYVKKFASQVGGFIACGEEERLLTGEFDIFVYDCGSARVSQMKAKGIVIGWTAPTDVPMLGYLFMGVPKNAAHPNAAKLWINYMLGRAAQDVMYEYEFADHHLVPGSKAFAEVDRLTKSGVKFYELTIEALEAEAAKGVKSLRTDVTILLRDGVPKK